MSELKSIIKAYKSLSFTDRIIFYSTISNNISVNDENLQSFLTEVRLESGGRCVYCEGTHVVKNGVRKDGVQRYLCRDCRRSFIPSTQSVTSRTRKHLFVWMHYVQCMLEHKTLKETAVECEMSVSTAFSWRHKILDAVSELAENVFLTGIVEADETFVSVSYKGNHSRSRSFSMPRKAHKRGNLGNYIVWNNLMMCNHRNQEELKKQLIGQLLKVRMTLYCRDISDRPPLPTVA